MTFTSTVGAMPYKASSSDQPHPPLPLITQPPDKPGEKTEKQAVIYLNTATIQQLETLKGVGTKKAQAIVDYRKRYGHFKVLQDLLKVKGIGPAILRENKDKLRL